jgi:predicted CopG family antitoxin
MRSRMRRSGAKGRTSFPAGSVENPTAVDNLHLCMHGACMATKTISIDLVAYEALNRARKTPDESFSRVIRRAVWTERSPATGLELLEMLKKAPAAPEDLVGQLEANQAMDTPPKDPWDE